MPDRIEFDLGVQGDALLPRQRRSKVTVDGRYLYGAPAVELDLEGEVKIARRRARVALPAISFGSCDDEERGGARRDRAAARGHAAD